MPATSTTPFGTFSEAMFRTDDLDGAAAYWTETLGFTITSEQRPSWVMLEDPHNAQRFVLMGAKSDSGPCLGFETTDFETSLAHLVERGGAVEDRSPEGTDEFQWARCVDAFGLPIMLWQNAAE